MTITQKLLIIINKPVIVPNLSRIQTPPKIVMGNAYLYVSAEKDLRAGIIFLLPSPLPIKNCEKEILIRQGFKK